MSQPSNRLAILDELAITTGRDYRQSGESYMAAAAKLVKARDLCEHGEWGPHLEKTGIPERTATRMIRLARAGIKSATVADLGVGRVDEILAQVPEATAGLVWPETGETITGDEIVRMREYADCAHEIWRAFMDLAEKEENPWLKGRMIQAIPDGFHSADTWIRWYDDLVDADAIRETDPDALAAVVDRSPWLPGRLYPGTDPATIELHPNPDSSESQRADAEASLDRCRAAYAARI